MSGSSLEMVWGPSYRQIVDLGDLQSSQFVMPMGQSGHLLEEEYDSLLDLWRRNEYIGMRTEGYQVAQQQTLE